MAEESSGGKNSSMVGESTSENQNGNEGPNPSTSPTESNEKKPASLDDAEKGKVKLAVEDKTEDPTDDEEEELLFPGFMAKTFFFMKQSHPVRLQFLRLITWSYPFIKKNYEKAQILEYLVLILPVCLSLKKLIFRF
ncbi:hypothetical protein SNE40_005303 [Patella caerulea]|uniref:Uncharacterized protein n=1 Tax=Patella caerulea TaxID=87958 RepID=A0AAN8K7J5_PATCE